MLYVQFSAPDDGWRHHLKHVEHFAEINKMEKCYILLVIFWELRKIPVAAGTDTNRLTTNRMNGQ